MCHKMYAKGLFWSWLTSRRCRAWILGYIYMGWSQQNNNNLIKIIVEESEFSKLSDVFIVKYFHLSLVWLEESAQSTQHQKIK